MGMTWRAASARPNHHVEVAPVLTLLHYVLAHLAAGSFRKLWTCPSHDTTQYG